MSGRILVEVFNEKELKDVVVNNGVDVNWFYKTDVNFHGNSIVVWLGENSWSYSTVDYLKEENVKYSDVISYETYINKYGVFNPKSQPEEDMVNHPSHYTQFDRETIDTMKGMSTPEEFRGHLKLTTVKEISAIKKSLVTKLSDIDNSLKLVSDTNLSIQSELDELHSYEERIASFMEIVIVEN